MSQAAFWTAEYRRWREHNRPRTLPGAEPAPAFRPRFAVLVDARCSTAKEAMATLGSLVAQRYDRWQAWLIIDSREVFEGRSDARIHVLEVPKAQELPAACRRVLEASECEFVCLVVAGDELKTFALMEVACCLNEQPSSDLVYADSDRRAADGLLTAPFFKPGWSPSLLLSFDYLSPFFARRDLVLQALQGSDIEPEAPHYELALRVSEASKVINHIARPLLTQAHRPITENGGRDIANRAALGKALVRRGRAGRVVAGRRDGTYRILDAIEGRPRVTIIIPTRDRLDLLRSCLDSVRTKTSYDNYEFMIIDNESMQPASLDFFATFDGQVYRYPHAFNYARMMNLAAQQARSEYLLFLNNDAVVISPDWIESLLAPCQQDSVGFVGARLLYPDESVHHEGITLGRHGVSVAHIRFEGYQGLGEVTREVAAVTGACMMTRASVFRELGGFDERMAVGYNDVDLCLRAWRHGHAVVYAGDAELYHITGASRGSVLPLQDEWFFIERWAPLAYADPYFSPNLSQSWPVGI